MSYTWTYADMAYHMRMLAEEFKQLDKDNPNLVIRSGHIYFNEAGDVMRELNVEV